MADLRDISPGSIPALQKKQDVFTFIVLKHEEYPEFTQNKISASYNGKHCNLSQGSCVLAAFLPDVCVTLKLLEHGPCRTLKSFAEMPLPGLVMLYLLNIVGIEDI